MHKLMVKKVSIGRGTVIQCSTSACYIKLFIHKTSPYLVENLHIIRIFLFQAKISHTCIEIVCTYSMSQNLFMLLQRNLILVIIHTIFYTVAKSDCLPRKLQISFITSSTVHFHKSHIMRRADGSLNFSGALCFFVKMLQIICGFCRYCKEIILSGNSLVHTRCCKHMTKIINLKIIDIAHS